MVEVEGPQRSRGLTCSVARRAGAIDVGPSPVLLPPGGPADLFHQLTRDAHALRRLRAGAGLDVTSWHATGPSWAGMPFEAVAGPAQLIARQLAPVRSRAILAESYRREAGHPPALRLAYAMAWLALGHGGADGAIRRRRGRRAARSR